METGSSARTLRITDPCKEGPPHFVEPMHHVDHEGRHHCPTGYLWCSTHGEDVGTFDGPAGCDHSGGSPGGSDG